MSYQSSVPRLLDMLAGWSIFIFVFAGSCYLMDPWPCETSRPWSLLTCLFSNVVYSVQGLSNYLSASTWSVIARRLHLSVLILALVSSIGVESLAEWTGWPLGVSGCDGTTILRFHFRAVAFLLLPHFFAIAALEFLPPGPRTTVVAGWATRVFRRCCPESLLRRNWRAGPGEEQIAKPDDEKLRYFDDPDGSGR
ncbi:hypothetical protein ISF_09874 [Cordyceps fumosorosea ARSEF 2679]|uniref:Transmembrane protein n=1 Tax=Cordyceps fumosorosea (strain ARSEF 2679) TaxID=1081104 RepID=A0A167AH50_CORFA|nr:hypothetical protein ISF_09874 [Cordyceps fumosorosea ARSEF 2679]OAA38910.1 hypothetical protein ISF_09874 [Cordyceps fumosorosea ARSEF 2679]